MLFPEPAAVAPQLGPATTVRQLKIYLAQAGVSDAETFGEFGQSINDGGRGRGL
jgi:hypothetical protein